MASEKQIDANRRNAQKSTGPKTDAGKAKARMNAVKHGLLAKVPVLPDEDCKQIDKLGFAILERLAPVGALEQLLAERVVLSAIRLQRAARIEAEVFLAGQANFTMLHYLITDQKKPDLGFAFVDDAKGVNALSKLSRYETTLERSLFKALHELQRLQAARAGNDVAPPVAVDIDLSSDIGFVSNNSTSAPTVSQKDAAAPEVSHSEAMDEDSGNAAPSVSQNSTSAPSVSKNSTAEPEAAQKNVEVPQIASKDAAGQRVTQNPPPAEGAKNTSEFTIDLDLN